MRLLWPLLPLLASFVPLQGVDGLDRLADPKRAVLGEKHAYLPLAARAAALGTSGGFQFSGDGKGLLIARNEERWDRLFLDSLAGRANSGPMDPEWILTWHDVETGASRDLWRGKRRQFAGFTSLEGAPFVLVESYSLGDEVGAHQVSLVGPNGLRLLAEARMAPESETATHLDTSVSPLGTAWACLTYRSTVGVQGSASSAVVRILDPSGKLSSVPLPLPGGTVVSGIQGWSKDGRSVVIAATRFDRVPDKDGKPVRRAVTDLILVDRATARVSPAPARLEMADRPDGAEAEVMLATVPAQATVGKDKDETGATLLVSRDGKSRTILFPGLAEGVLAPRARAVAYAVEGAVFIRRLAVLDRATFEKLAEEAGRREAINTAKQAALAALMYGADYDDVMPGADQNITEILMPYMKDRDVLDQFVYLFQGGDLTKVEKPAETVLGYVRYKGGRAVAYLDGHVVWIPDP